MDWKAKSLSEKSGLISLGLNLIAFVAFIIYGMLYNYLDAVVLATIGIGALGMAGYLFLRGKWTEMLNLLAVVSTSFGLGLFFLNSYPVWADRLNHISMYASRGTLVPVVAIMILLVATIVSAIISCFNAKGGKA